MTPARRPGPRPPPRSGSGPGAALGPAGLLPGAPELYPEVSGGRARLADATAKACRELALRLVASRPDRLLVVSPHAARRGGAFGLSSLGRAAGDLAEHGAPGVAVDLPVDSGLAVGAWAAAEERNVATWDRPPALDARTVAALAFLVEAGWAGPTSVLSLPLATGPHELAACGRALRATVHTLAGRTAAVAVGEGCRSVRPGSPGDFHPEAVLFDRRAGHALLDGDPEDLLSIERPLRELAGETLVDPIAVLLAALDGAPRGTRLTSYENALGTGHLVAILHDDGTN